MTKDDAIVTIMEAVNFLDSLDPDSEQARRLLNALPEMWGEIPSEEQAVLVSNFPQLAAYFHRTT